MKNLSIILLLILATGCIKKNNTTDVNMNKEDFAEEAKKYEILAGGICDCSKDVILLFKEIQEMGSVKDEAVAVELEEKLDIESGKSEDCIKELKKANSKAKDLDEVMMENALKEYCSDFYNMLKIGRIK